MTDLRRIAAQLAYHGETRKGWADYAACRTMPKSVFFGNQGSHYVEARRACASCPVRMDCLSEVLPLVYNEDRGFRGGLTSRERDDMRPMVREFTVRVAS